MHQTICPHSTNQLSCYSTKGYPQPYMAHLPFCNYTGSTTLLQYPQYPLIIFLHSMVGELFHCILSTPSHTSPSPLTTLLSPFPPIHPTLLPYTFYQQKNAILQNQLTFFTVPPVVAVAFSE